MQKSKKSAIVIIGMLIILSLLLAGCYTQLSRPRVATEDEYINDSEIDEEAYYQDQEAQDSFDQPAAQTYIYNYYAYPDPFFDPWYYYPYSWRYYNWGYLGPYPDFWWDPYGRWWAPGWYAGFAYYDGWWGNHPRHRYSNYGYYPNPSNRTYTQRPFARRSFDTIDRDRRATDTQTGLARPQTPTRTERPPATAPDVIRKPDTRDALRVPKHDKPIRTAPRIKDGDVIRDAKAKPREVQRDSNPQKIKPRDSQSDSKPKMIETAPSRKQTRDNNSSYQPAPRSNNRSSTPSHSNQTQVSKPAPRSSAPASHPAPKSSSSTSSSKSSGSSSSKSSGSSKTNNK